MTNPANVTSRAMRLAKIAYVAVHATLVLGRWLLIFLVGLAMGGAGGEGPMRPQAPETGPVASEELVSKLLLGTAVLSIVVPLARRRFDLMSVAGSFVIVALLWVQADIQYKLVHGDPDYWRTAATLYTTCVAAPFTLIGLLGHMLRRREVRAAKSAARGACPGCGFDRGSIKVFAPCPECGATSIAVKMLKD